LLNPTTSFLYQYRDLPHNARLSLVPGLFEIGEAKESVAAKMAAAGIERWSKRYNDVSNPEVFHLVAGHDFACGHELFLEVDYDESDRVWTATVHQGGACF
jgi:hypothetical protein